MFKNWFKKGKNKMNKDQQENSEVKNNPETETAEQKPEQNEPVNEEAASEAKAQTTSSQDQKPAEKAEEPKPEKPEETDAEKIESLEKELAETKKRYLMALADYQNLSKRSTQQQTEARFRGVADFLKKLLPVLDTLDKAMEQCMKSEVDKKVMDGLEMFSIQFSDMLNKEGLKEISALGSKFDPNCQEAMMKQSVPDKEDEEVIQVFEKGYTFKDQVLRCAKVVVNQK